MRMSEWAFSAKRSNPKLMVTCSKPECGTEFEAREAAAHPDHVCNSTPSISLPPQGRLSVNLTIPFGMASK